MADTNTSASAVNEYKLSRNWLASSRLHLQHFFIKFRAGWFLHPTIRANITTNTTTTNTPLRVADIAAGNCIWSFDLLSEIPTAEVTAFDVSTAQFPRLTDCPPNLHLETWDIFTPPPLKYHGYFDVIHIAFVIAIFPNGRDDRVIQHLLQLLKPGGWIQWNDVAPPGVVPVDKHTLKALPKSEWPMPTHFLNSTFGGMFDQMKWLNRLDQALADCGFVETEFVRLPVKRELLKLEYDMARFIYDELTSSAFKMVGDSQEGREKIKEVNQALEKMWSAAERGETILTYDTLAAVGRKPGVR